MIPRGNYGDKAMANTWSNRDKLTRPRSVQEQALELVADRLSDLMFTYCRNSYQNDDSREQLKLDLAEVKNFADKHEIPFSVDLNFAMVIAMAKDSAEVWQNSSVNC